MRARGELGADCGACRGLCCVGPGFVASADFAHDKPAGRPCPHLGGDDLCTIHDRLPERGFPGCVTFDCFGAGQRIVAASGGVRDDTVLAALEVLRALHEILWYLVEAREHERASPLTDEVDALERRVEAAAAAPPAALLAEDVDARRAEAAPLLTRVADLVRAPAGPDHTRADLVGRDLRRDLTGAGLRGALLLGADLRGADLTRADLRGADLRGADVRGADLGAAVFLTAPQLTAARGDATTRVPGWFSPPRAWTAGPVVLPTPVAPPRARSRGRGGRPRPRRR